MDVSYCNAFNLVMAIGYRVFSYSDMHNLLSPYPTNIMQDILIS